MSFSPLLLIASAITSPAVPDSWFSAFLTAAKSADVYFEQAELVEKPNRVQVAAALPHQAKVSYRVEASVASNLMAGCAIVNRSDFGPTIALRFRQHRSCCRCSA